MTIKHKIKLITTVSTLSVGLGVGAFFGAQLNRSSGNQNQNIELRLGLGLGVGHRVESRYAETKRDIYSLLPVPSPTVYAASVPVQTSSSTDVITRHTTTSANRVSEIMKHGFPGLTNVRSYQGFVLSYDQRNRVANWVCEHIKPEHCEKNKETDRTKSDFYEDKTIHGYFRGTNHDYKRSGYDRGHLAAAGNHRYSQDTMNQTFLLSNIAPQVELI